MKIPRYRYLMLLMVLMAMCGIHAQTNNRLVIPDVTVQLGQTQLPIHIENMDEIVAVQFDLTLPTGMTAEAVGTLSNRGDDHQVTVRSMGGQRWRVLLYSPQNRPLKGQSGVVMYVPVTIPSSYAEGSEHQLIVSDVTLSNVQTENVLTGVDVGKVKISKLPDLKAKNIIADKETLTPGENVVISWQIENIGELATSGGWSEQISLVSADGFTSKLLATTYYESTLDAKGVVSRQVELTVPMLLGIEGKGRLQVRIVAGESTGESTSAQANNTQKGDVLLNVEKKLSFELQPSRVQENTGTRITAKLNRSGSWAEEQTYTLTATEDSRISVPTSVKMSAGQSGAVFYLRINDNSVLDEDSIVTITAEGNSYDPVNARLTIVDNEYPNLKVQASKSEITEGETFQLTITTSRVSDKPIAVTLTSERVSRFIYSKTVTIPAGESSVIVNVTAVDDDEIELKESIAFHASAEKYNQGECIVLLDDNDMPTLSFTLSPETVSESDGFTALYGVIKRTDNFNKRVTLKLSDDSNGLLNYSYQTIVLAKNQSEVQFNIGVNDNDRVDGNHVVNVTATVYASSCNCSVTDDTKGSVTATVTIVDDDGPALKIKPVGTAMLEGSEDNVFTISHNIQSVADVTVHVSSDKDDMLEYDHEIIIPAGQSTAKLHVKVKGNDQQDDSSLVTFKVESDGYVMGTCWIVITDQTLPDATISLYADKTEAEAGGTVLLRAVIKNVGNALLSSTTPVNISFSGRKEIVSLKVGKNVVVGDSAIIEYNYDLPTITGLYTFDATVNATQKVPEIIYTNNTSKKVGITLNSPFTLTANADKDIYRQDEDIIISGRATGNASKNAEVEVYIINEGARQTVNVTTDEGGNYTINWKPLSKQSGHFYIGACYPGANESETMDAFDVYGIKAKDNFKTCELSQTETQSGTIVLSNPGNLVQTGLTLTPKAESANCVFTYDVPASIPAGKSVNIAYTIKGNSVSEGSDWQQMPLEITTAEGSHLDYNIYYYVHPLKAKLQTSQSYINTTMSYGTPREYPVTIRNIGRAETGRITLSLPNWIQTVTPNEMASLAQGDSATILLRFIPTEAMKLNVRVTGQIGINCANGDGTSISFNLTPVSEVKGKLKVDVIDEYTYYTDEAPHVSNAIVKVKNPSTNEVVAEGKTSDDGIFITELPEGYYSVTVDADKHDSYANTVIVDPGIEKEEEVFLSYQAITYSWEVVETTVEDAYEIEIVPTYETRVPKPVVTINLPDERPTVNGIFAVAVTNHGLVRALDFHLDLHVSDGYSIEFFTDQDLESLAPQQTHVFYAKLLASANESQSYNAMRRAGGGDVCLSLGGDGGYNDPCEKNPSRQHSSAGKTYGHCSGSGGSGGWGGWGGSGGWGGGWGGSGGGGGYGPGSPSIWGNKNVSGGYNIWNIQGTPSKNCSGNSNNGNSGGSGNGGSGNGGYGNGGNGSGNSNGNNPPFVPETPPDENNNCDEVPELHYTLISNDGHRYKMKGVAADGVSQVVIVFDSIHKSSIPKEDCDWTCHWSLEDDNGKIGKLDNEESWDNVVYTAPEDFPANESGNAYPINVVITYTNGIAEYTQNVTIELNRVPLVLLHGLNADPGTWEGFELYLKREMYKDYQIDNTGYKNTNCSYFNTNLTKAQEKINKVINLYKKNGIWAEKADLIGHSMGGILSRLHVEYVMNSQKPNVHKLITVNTPHSGSEIGDLVQQGKIVRDLIDAGIPKFFDQFSSTEAIFDLAVNSEAIAKLNNPSVLGKMTGIPVHSVTSVVNDWRTLLTMGAVGAMANYRGRSWFGPIVHLWNLGYTYEMESALAVSDLVVPYESQVGGLTGYTTWNASSGTYEDAFHCNNPQNHEVWEHLINLLKISGDDSNFFCKSGFKPAKRSVSFSRRKAKEINSNRVPIRVNASLGLRLSITDDSLNVNIFPDNQNIVNTSLSVNFGDIDYISSKNFSVKIPSTFEGEVSAYAICRTNEDEIILDSAFLNINRSKAMPIELQVKNSLFAQKEDTVFVQITCVWDDGSTTYVFPDNVVSNKGIVLFDGEHIIAQKTGEEILTFNYKGLSCSSHLLVYAPIDDISSIDEEDSPSICSTVTLSFKQKNVMTRQAFRGSLTIKNGNETTAMKDVKMNLEVRDMDGNLTTSHEFQIDAESLNGFEGNLDFTSGWMLGGGETGVATILFIPTKYAAPTEPKDYSFGGSFSYTDPYSGLTVTRDLNPVTLTVKPSPELDLTYFMQRDVYGDDPLTLDVVEPMKPAEFALLINNKGNGDATNVRMVTQQPEIIENEKGLLIDFELISSQVNGKDAVLSFGQSIANDFGNIPAHSQMYAQWWLTSTLLGHFTDYKVEASHVTSYGNEDLSLLDQVTIHELIHSLEITKDGKQLRGFMVNDIADADDLPDMLYLTNAETAPVSIAATTNVVKKSATEYWLTVTPSQEGWNYGNLYDPTHGLSEIKRIVRKSDNKEIPLQNFWQTDRTLRDGKDWLYEYRLHFADEFANGAEIYVLTVEPTPEVLLKVASIEGVPAEGDIAIEAVDEITVNFNKQIEPATFTTDDLTLAVQGVKQDVSQITISSEDNKKFGLNLSKLNEQLGNGYYTLTVQTADITDNEGYQGRDGKQVGWIFFQGGLVQLLTSAWPVNSGTVSRKTEAEGAPMRRAENDENSAQYGSTVILVATPENGYEFSNWTLNGEVVSTEQEFSTTALGDMNVVANFVKKSYHVDIVADSEGGSITGAGTGIYEFGTSLRLTAVPTEDYVLKGWLVNGEPVAVGTNNTLDIMIDAAQTVTAVFEREFYRQSMTLARGWNWVSSYLGESLDIETISSYANRIVGQFDELIRDPQYGMVGGLTQLNAGESYKVEANMTFRGSFRGHLYNVETAPLQVHKGWNWLAYPHHEQMPIRVITNAEEGDYMTSQTGFAEFAAGKWEGTLETIEPGAGYLYKSVTDKVLVFDFTAGIVGNRAQRISASARESMDVDIHRYPNTMNITMQIQRNGSEVVSGNYNIYAMVGDELRGVSKQIGNNHYLTVYGDKSGEVSFIVESADTGETFETTQTLAFRDDVVGSRKSPYILQIGNTTGIESVASDGRPMTVYSMEGILMSRDATKKALKQLPRGVYIVNGRKCFVK